MESPATITILGLFGLSTVLTYLAVRRAWTRTLPGAAIGTIANSVWLTVYSLVKGHLFLAALIIGVGLGLLFTALTVSIALFFRSNPPGTHA